MSDIAIKVEGLSKRYRIGAQQHHQYRTLRDTLNGKALAPFRAARHLLKRNGNGHGPSDYKKSLIDASSSQLEPSSFNGASFWALKDVSFEVKQGEVLGIIGRNGAGKSTLLKVLSRITEPTDGYADITGRLASLLEVGTGFHPELTGRENIFLNGSILGMRRAEIHLKFDEIVTFAEVEKFIDTPVKHYSSGMYVRLAFAVAAHLDPEILLVDEVLAVGDAAFQKKCLGKMGAVAKEGRTVLFVSHNMAAVQNLCGRAMLLEHGGLEHAGDVESCIATYLGSGITPHDGDVDLRVHPSRRRDALPWLKRVRLLDVEGRVKNRFQSGDSIKVEFTLDPQRKLKDPQFGIGIHDWLGSTIFSLATYFSDSELPALAGPGRVVCSIDNIPLAPGRYVLSLSAGTTENPLIDAIDNALSLDVEPVDFYGNGRIPDPSLGRVLVRSRWEMSED